MQILFVITVEECDFPSLIGSPFFPAPYREYYLTCYLVAIDLLYRDALPEEDPAEKLPRMLEAALQIAPDDPRVQLRRRMVEARDGKIVPGEP
jgi:hypothetical protein